MGSLVGWRSPLAFQKDIEYPLLPRAHPDLSSDTVSFDTSEEDQGAHCQRRRQRRGDGMRVEDPDETKQAQPCRSYSYQTG